MKNLTENRKKILIVGVSCLVFVCLAGTSIFILSLLMKDDGGKRKRQVQRVALVKPPPPKKLEKPPEPEIKKKQEIIEPEPEETPPEEMDDASDEDMPPGEELGLDSDGTGGADGFGLKAKKGGRSLIGGAGGSSSLLRRYAWYTRILQDEIRDMVNQYLEGKTDIPAGKHKMVLRIRLDGVGNMELASITTSSGNKLVDHAVEEAITGFRVSEGPPEEMPRIMNLKVTFKS